MTPKLKISVCTGGELRMPDLVAWDSVSGGGDGVQAGILQPSTEYALQLRRTRLSHMLDANICGRQFPVHCRTVVIRIMRAQTSQTKRSMIIYITDPPYGDAVNTTRFSISSSHGCARIPRRSSRTGSGTVAARSPFKGEGEDFRRGMVAAYKRMTECMPDNGIQVIMFTHQSGSIWADMANIVWASGLQVTAAWYVATETDSALREGSYVKGTVLLVLRKRLGVQKTTRDDLAWEIQEEVQKQVDALAGLNQEAKGLYRDENVFEDADIQMAGYAAALRVLTRYAT